MSENERKRRLYYKQNRKRWIIIQAVAIILLLGVALGCAFAYFRVSEDRYISYTESSTVDYKVQMKPDSFHEEWLGPNQAYVASQIDNVSADFEYLMNMDTKDIAFYYTYKIDAVLNIMVTDYGNLSIFEKVYPLVEEMQVSSVKNNLIEIKENVIIDYDAYNNLANEFIDTYGFSKDVKSLLTVKLSVNVKSFSNEFATDGANSYQSSLTMPLTDRATKVELSQSVPTGESKVLARKNQVNENIFKGISITTGSIDAVLLIIFVAFVFLTRNEDINYSIKVKKIFNGYRSFIQKINNEFDTTPYRILMVDSFNEMLAIRDTIMSPILMHENYDQTMTRFFIPTSSDLLYVFEIKVDNYDEIYGNKENDTVAENDTASVDITDLYESTQASEKSKVKVVLDTSDGRKRILLVPADNNTANEFYNRSFTGMYGKDDEASEIEEAPVLEKADEYEFVEIIEDTSIDYSANEEKPLEEATAE